jgi:adenosine deaminase
MSILDSAPLLEETAERKIPCTICPISILKFDRMKSLEELQLRTLMDKGVLVSIHSDDAAYNGAYIAENYYKVAKDLDLTTDMLEALARNSFLSAFMDESSCQQYLEEISSFMRDYKSPFVAMWQ